MKWFRTTQKIWLPLEIAIACLVFRSMGAIFVTKNVSHANVTCHKIETSNGTYYYDKDGAGLASLVDSDGKDWIGFDKDTYGSGGYWRGFPNAVHNQDISCFHPLNSSTEKSTSTILSETSDHVQIKAVCGNWEGMWDFYDSYCKFTMTKMTSGKKYWILYEGTPYGEEKGSNVWFYKSNNDTKHSCSSTEIKGSDLPDPEWVAFGHNSADHVLLVTNFDGGSQDDRYYWLKKMSVFGFARGSSTGSKQFTSVPPFIFYWLSPHHQSF